MRVGSGNGKGNDRRQFGRRRAHIHAWLHFRGREPLACVITDLSVDGAGLEMEVPGWFRRDTVLLLEIAGVSAQCEVRHRTNHFIGVQFVRPAPIDEDATVFGWVGEARGAPCPVLMRPEPVRVEVPSTTELRASVVYEHRRPPRIVRTVESGTRSGRGSVLN